VHELGRTEERVCPRAVGPGHGHGPARTPQYSKRPKEGKNSIGKKAKEDFADLLVPRTRRLPNTHFSGKRLTGQMA